MRLLKLFVHLGLWPSGSKLGTACGRSKFDSYAVDECVFIIFLSEDMAHLITHFTRYSVRVARGAGRCLTFPSLSFFLLSNVCIA